MSKIALVALLLFSPSLQASELSPRRSIEADRTPLSAVLVPSRGPSPEAPGLSPRRAASPKAPASACDPGSFRNDFSRNPFGRRGGFSIDAGAEDQFLWADGALHVRYDSSLPTARATASLGRTVTSEDCFRFGAVFTLDSVEAGPDDFFQIAFALSSSTTTGTNRTGTTPLFGDADTFDMVEASYFPNVTPFGGPTLAPTVFGSESGFGDAFSNFSSVFGPAADLGDNISPQVSSLPLGVPIQAEIRYDPSTQTMTFSLIQLAGSRPEVIETGLVPLGLDWLTGSPLFSVDEFSINSFLDAADFDPTTVSLRADVRYDEVWFELCCP